MVFIKTRNNKKRAINMGKKLQYILTGSWLLQTNPRRLSYLMLPSECDGQNELIHWTQQRIVRLEHILQLCHGHTNLLPTRIKKEIFGSLFLYSGDVFNDKLSSPF